MGNTHRHITSRHFAPRPDPQTHEEILQHLEQILSHPLFRNSRRYAAVLRYIVECTLQGNEAQLKERTIGIEVFHRTPDYDTANDHVVRSAMSEVRRRLTQYYGETGSESEVRIELQPGSYVPHFGRGTTKQYNAISATALVARSEILPLLTHQKRLAFGVEPYFWRNWSSCRCHFAFRNTRTILCKPSGPRFFPRPNQFCFAWNIGRRPPIGRWHWGRKPPVTLSDFHSADTQLIHISDAITLADWHGCSGSTKKQVRLASQSEANFSDLQNGPAVLVGLKNNDWTERLISNLRFTVGQDSQRQVMINSGPR